MTRSPILSGVGETMTLVGDCVATVWAAGDGAVQAAYIHPDDLAEINKARACDAGVTDPARLAAWMVRFRFHRPGEVLRLVHAHGFATRVPSDWPVALPEVLARD